MYYISKAHRHRFQNAVKKNPEKCSDKYLASLYLLCADFDLRMAADKAVHRMAIKFSECKQSNLTVEQYTLFRAAQDIYTGSTYITLQDLSDYHLIYGQVFEAILEALRIARQGYEYIGIAKPFNALQ